MFAQKRPEWLKVEYCFSTSSSFRVANEMGDATGALSPCRGRRSRPQRRAWSTTHTLRVAFDYVTCKALMQFDVHRNKRLDMIERYLLQQENVNLPFPCQSGHQLRPRSQRFNTHKIDVERHHRNVTGSSQNLSQLHRSVDIKSARQFVYVERPLTKAGFTTYLISSPAARFSASSRRKSYALS